MRKKLEVVIDQNFELMNQYAITMEKMNNIPGEMMEDVKR